MLSKTIYLIRGLPGAGKSTLAKSLGVGAFIYEADQYFYKDGEYKFDASKLGLAHKQCLDNTIKCMELGFSCAVSNTFTTEKELKPYIQAAEEYGFIVTSLIVENRHGSKSIHGVPENTLDKMEKRFNVKLRP